MAVKPTRSAKRTLTNRRSAVGAAADGAAATALTGAALSDASRVDPHSPQNRAPGVLGVPQVGQPAIRRVPHWRQNLRPASFAAPQLPQFIANLVSGWAVKHNAHIHGLARFCLLRWFDTTPPGGHG